MSEFNEIFPTTRGVRAYISTTGFLVILQEAEDHQDGEQQILIPPSQIKTFIKAIQAVAKAK